MKKNRICMLLAAVLLLAVLTGCAGKAPAAAAAPAGKQTAYAVLDQEGKAFGVTVDLSGGWSVEFTPGAVYLYDGEAGEGIEACAMGVSLDKEVYDEYVAESEAAGNAGEYNGGIAYTDGDGRETLLLTVEDQCFFILTVEKEGLDKEAVFGRFELSAR